MDAAEARGRILEAGKSGELIAAFQALAEATTPAGELKYPPRVGRELARAIVCRNYAASVLQLCHLVNAADACGRGPDRYERFFFAGGRATASDFRARVADAVASRGWRRPGFEHTEEGIVVRYRDGVFNVRFSRMPLLAALFEFLVMAEGYADIDALLGEMLAEPSSQAAVKRAASGIEGRLYRYLGRHLPSAQNQGKFNAILAFLKARTNDGTIEIDDQTVLDFWCDGANGQRDDGGDFRLYRTAFEAFVTFIRTLDAAEHRKALASALPIGGDREAGEVDPEALDGWLEAADEWRSPLDLLAEEAAGRIKFLNNKEQEYLRLLMDCGPEAGLLPLSLLRAEVFGKSQARITQGLRRKLGGKAMRELIVTARPETYREREAAYAALRAHVRRVLKATLHALLHEAPEGGEDAAALARDDLAGLLHGGRDDAPGAGDERLDGVIEEARRAFRALEREGFEERGLDDAAIVAGFRGGAEALIRIERQVEGFLDVVRQLDGGEPGLEGWFGRDHDVFRGRFLSLYGE